MRDVKHEEEVEVCWATHQANLWVASSTQTPGQNAPYLNPVLQLHGGILERLHDGNQLMIALCNELYMNDQPDDPVAFIPVHLCSQPKTRLPSDRSVSSC